ncbi:MAG TPA: hypothetical protein VJ898_03325 [Natrialbaceae archaeon]|nr:hypothetical protein [Natrialbaceae archaeon]
MSFASDSSSETLPGRVAESSGSRSGGSGYRPSRDPMILLLIFIVAAAVVAMLTGVGISLQGGTGGGPLFPFPEGGANESVSVSVNRTTISPGESVEVTVTRANATPVANATVVAGEDRYRTGPNGTAVVTFSEPGSYEIAARPPGTNESSRTATVTVRVRRPAVELTVATNRSTIDVGQSVAITLLRTADETPVTGTIAVGNRTVRTGSDGRVVVTFDRGGRRRIVARKNASDGTRYVDGTATVRVRRHVANLAIDLTDEVVPYGNRTTVTVTRKDTGEPIEATVTVGDRTVRTGLDGRATLPSVPPGSHDVVAEATPTATVRFEPATTTLQVHRRSVRLEIAATPSRLPVGNRTTLTVRRADTDEPVAARIEVGDRVLRTGQDGRVDLELDRPGRFGVVATRANTSTETFEAAGTVVVWTGPDVHLTTVDVSSVAVVDRPVTVTVTLENRGNEPARRTITVTLSGDRRVSRTVRIPPDDRRTAELSVLAPSSPGDEFLVVDTGDGWRPFVVRLRSGNVSAGMNYPG